MSAMPKRTGATRERPADDQTDMPAAGLDLGIRGIVDEAEAALLPADLPALGKRQFGLGVAPGEAELEARSEAAVDPAAGPEAQSAVAVIDRGAGCPRGAPREVSISAVKMPRSQDPPA